MPGGHPRAANTERTPAETRRRSPWLVGGAIWVSIVLGVLVGYVAPGHVYIPILDDLTSVGVSTGGRWWILDGVLSVRWWWTLEYAALFVALGVLLRRRLAAGDPRFRSPTSMAVVIYFAVVIGVCIGYVLPPHHLYIPILDDVTSLGYRVGNYVDSPLYRIDLRWWWSLEYAVLFMAVSVQWARRWTRRAAALSPSSTASRGSRPGSG